VSLLKRSSDGSQPAPAQSAVKPAPSNYGSPASNALRGAGTGLYDAARGMFGNQDAMNRVREDANRLNYSQFKNTVDAARAVGGSLSSVPTHLSNFGKTLNTLGLVPSMNNVGGAVEKGVLNWIAEPVAQSKSFSQVLNAGGEAARRTAIAANLKNNYNALKGSFEQLPSTFEKVKSQMAESEGRRMAAGATLPVLEFLQNNPWAKWALLAGGGLLGGAAIGNLMGGGALQARQQGNPVTSAMNQGYMGQIGPYRNSINYM
jgi:hypothetical protein